MKRFLTGISNVMAVVLVAIIGLVGFGGWLVYEKLSSGNQEQTAVSNIVQKLEVDTKKELKDSTKTYSGDFYSFTFPSNWKISDNRDVCVFSPEYSGALESPSCSITQPKGFAMTSFSVAKSRKKLITDATGYNGVLYTGTVNMKNGSKAYKFKVLLEVKGVKTEGFMLRLPHSNDKDWLEIVTTFEDMSTSKHFLESQDIVNSVKIIGDWTL